MAISGYRYYFGIHMGIGRGPVDELIQINVGDRPAWYGKITETSQFFINNPGMFGDDAGEGGIKGPVDVMMGEPDQHPSDGLAAMLPAPVSGFRGMMTLFFNGLISANNPYPKAWKFRVRRLLKGWDGPVFEPNLCSINLVRPVSAGETPTPDGNPVAEVATLEGDETITVQNLQCVMSPPDSTAIVRVWGVIYDFGYGQIDLGPNDWTASGNTVTFNPDSPFLNEGYFSDWNGQRIRFFYDYDHTVTSGQQTSNQVSGGEGLIRAMNPAHIIFQCLTDRIWGRGLDRAEIDTDSFKKCAQTLYDEKFGLCLKWSRTDSIQSFIQQVIDHIGAVLFVSKTTMLMTLHLIRGDYVVDGLPLFDSDSGLLKITQAAVGGVGPIVNEVEVTYHDPITDQDAAVRAQNIALKQAANGIVNSTKKTYTGIPLQSLAGRVAQRDLRAAAPGLRRFELVFDRRGYLIEPGSVIRIRDLPRGIKETIVRVARVQDGTLTSGQITVSAVQDVFGFPSNTYVGREPHTWQPPNRRPCLGRHKVFEMPYVALLKSNTAADFNAIDPTSSYIGALMEQGKPLNAGIRIAVKDGAPVSSENPTDQTWYCSI